MALNPEVEAYAKRIDAATNDLAEDIRRILANPSTQLSQEDRDTFELAIGKLEALGRENQ